MRRRLRLGPAAALVALALTGTGCAAVAAVAAKTEPRTDPKHPNIVFVLTDDLDSSLVKYMPQVRKLQREGVNFSDYSVTDSLCCPSRSSIFTGKFPHDTGVYTNVAPDGGFTVFHDRGNEKATFATRLQKAGYKTAMMGKYLNGYPVSYVPPGWNEWDVADKGYNEFNYAMNENGRRVRYGHRPKDYLTDVVAAKGASFIRRQAEAKNPFMLEIATFAPHGPYTPAPRDRNAFPGLKAPRDPSYNEADISDKPAWLSGHKKLTKRQMAKIDRVYRKRAQAVQAVDDLLAKLRATLSDTGQAENTYVVFSSDNGYHLGQHRLPVGKQTAFDTDVHVPLTAVGPGVPAGRTVSVAAQNIDLCPTFTDLGGAPMAGADGRSLAGLLHGQAPPEDWRDAGLVEHHGPNNAPGDPDRQTKENGNPPTYKALRTATATYVEYANGQREYYDRQRDPYELTNTYGQLSPSRRARLHKTVRALHTCHGTTSCTKAAHLKQ